MRTVAVVGASLAGLSAARALRSQGYDGRLVLIGDETHRPYDRPPLSKDFLAGLTGEAELALEHVAITRVTLAAVITAGGTAAAPDQEAEAAPGPSLVPGWRADLTGAHLPVGYRDVWRAVSGAPGPVRAQQLAADLGLQVTAAKVEGLRSKLKRLVARGWITEPAPGTFAPRATAPASPGAGP